MADWEDFLEDMQGDQKKKQPQPMWGEVIPKMEEKSGGILSEIGSIAGTLAQIGGTAATLMGQPEIGIPLSIGGSGLKGGSRGGITGALTGVGTASAATLAPEGVNKMIEGFKTPVDTGSFTAYSASGSPMTVPGVRPNSISTFSSQGSPMTVPASPKAIGGGS
jgi:hypothetical protein